MTWFRIDPIVKAIVKSLEEHPGRWRTDGPYVLLGEGERYDVPVRLYVSSTAEEGYVEEPKITLDRRSRRALHVAHEHWVAACGKASEQDNREALIAALEGSGGG